MLNECAADSKFLIVELCDDILIDTIVLANFEFFSSMFRTFRVSISDRYPAKGDRWKELGIFEARNSREIQAFPVVNPLIWTRYVRIEFLTHYGNEYYCPVSLLRVHGTTMMEEFRSEDESGRADDDVEEDELQPDHRISSDRIASGPSASETVATEEQKQNVTHVEEYERDDLQYEHGIPVMAANISDFVSSASKIGPAASTHSEIHPSSTASNGTVASEVPEVPSEQSTGSSFIGPENSQSSPNTGNANDAESTTSEVSSSANVESSESATVNSTRNATSPTPDLPPVYNVTLNNTDDGASSKPSQAIPESSRSPSAVQAPAASPTTQESFFKSIHKRLQMLEANSTLSLQYIEEQSRILREAFGKVEKRQAAKAEAFLQNLNDTVMAELRGFRQQYDQLWQSTVIELETHREQYMREMSALSTRLTLMADELVFQKRMAVVQATLLLLCLGLVLFVRAGASASSSSAAALELPLLQQLVGAGAGKAMRLRFDSPSPPASPSSRDASPPVATIRSFASSPAAVRTPSPPATRLNPRIALAPATPSDGDDDGSDDDDVADAAETDADADDNDDAELAELSGSDARAVRQTQSGPATPSGTRDSLHPLAWSGSEASDSGSGLGSRASSPAAARAGRPASADASGLRRVEAVAKEHGEGASAGAGAC